jgi:copper oxidase (laccase) domain-containing protein
VLEATVGAMRIAPQRLIAWLGPAIGPRRYEVGDEVRAAFLARDAAAASAFSAVRAGHWLLDLYAVARQRLAASGVTQVYGGGFCTYSDPARFYSYRREAKTGRMAALIWLERT